VPSCTDVAILGAGPYGLSIAAHLQGSGLTFRIFGRPMQTWCERMPDGMLLKSDGFASNLFDPASAFTLKDFCAATATPYDDTQLPVRLETFRAYGLAFQERLVPQLENKNVVRIDLVADTYRLHLSDGTIAHARNVILAVGISHFHHVPPELGHLPAEHVSHSSTHSDLRKFAGRRVAVMGGGASAVDTAVLLKEAGVDVTLVARRASLKFAGPPASRRRLWESLRHPRSPIGPGWRARLYSEAPWLFHRLPFGLRKRIVRQFLGPGTGWPMKDRFVGKVPTLLGCRLKEAAVSNRRVRLRFEGPGGPIDHESDHVIAATGYRVDLRRLTFLSEEIFASIASVEYTPVLSSSFESSVRGLYFVGMASMYEFGPLMRFACGAGWTARRVASRLAQWRSSQSVSTATLAAEAAAGAGTP
jgi:thioredoxin reductase